MIRDRSPEELLEALHEARTKGNRRQVQEITAALEYAVVWRPQPYQLPPDDPWWMWVFSGGAGSGKTDAGAWWINDHMQGPPCDARLPGGHKALIGGPTFSDAIGTCWPPPAGISIHNPEVVKIGRQDGTYVVWPNGAEALFVGLHTEHDADLLRARAANCCTWWIDEAAIARHLKLAIDMVTLRARAGVRPHGIVTSTPKPSVGWKYLIGLPGVVVTHASSFDNVYLSEQHKRVLHRFQGTRLEAQEIHGQLIDDYEGALWQRDTIDADRIVDYPSLELERMAAMRVVRSTVGLDPSTWDPELGSDPGTVGEGLETGIVVVGIDDQDPPHIYVFDDVSLRAAAKVWAGECLGAWRAWRTDHIAAEVNLGGMVLNTLRAVDPDVVLYKEKGKVGVRAKHSKRVRAEPVAALYDQHRVHHVGYFPALESQMVSWDPRENWSPDRIDALVYAVTALDPWRMGGGTSESSAAVLLAAGNLAGPRRGF